MKRLLSLLLNRESGAHMRARLKRTAFWRGVFRQAEVGGKPMDFYEAEELRNRVQQFTVRRVPDGLEIIPK